MLFSITDGMYYGNANAPLDLFQGNLGTHPVFFMRDISFKDLANIVEFMYRGKVNVAQSELGSFLKTAETLQVRGLTGDEEPAQPEVR